MRGRLALPALVVLAIGCGAEPGPPAPRAAPAKDAGTTAARQDARRPGEADALQPADADTRRCKAPAGVSASPGTVDQMVALINALPRPVTIPCVLESLARPLDVQAAVSSFSAQPSYGVRSPRFFIQIGALVITAVPQGVGKDLLEFGEFVDATRTLKGEIEFPVEEALDRAAPYTRVLVKQGGSSTCRGCHRDERESEAITWAPAFVSAALRPEPRARLALEAVAAERAICDHAKEPERCEFFDALFGHGEVRAKELPASLPTVFYDNQR